MKSRVVVLGGGFGGMELSCLLSEVLGEAADVTLIDKSDAFVFGFSKMDVMFRDAPMNAVRLPYRRFTRPGVRFVQEEIIAVDPTARRVTTSGGTYEAEFLVIALGADFDLAATPGLTGGGNEFYSVAGAERLSKILPNFTKGSAAVGICGFPYKCPPAPSECALMLHHYLVERGCRAACDITLVSPLSIPMPASVDLSKALMEAFDEAGIRILLKNRVLAVDDHRKIVRLEDGSDLPCDLFLGVPKHQAPQVIIDSGLTVDGWVPIDLATMETTFRNVFAVGDVAKTGLPKAGSFAESQARAVASAIIARTNGGQGTPNTGTGSCLVEFGDGRIGWADLDFLSGPELQSVYHAPSLAGRAHKDKFGADRKARWFGL